MRYRVIQEHDRRYPIRLMCRALAVSPTGYYAWRTRPASGRTTANQTLLTELRQLHHESRQTYGSPRMWRVLVERGRMVGRHRVARLMRHDGLRAKTVTKWRATPQSSHSFPVAANQLNRQFTVAAPNQVWAGDLTYIWTMEGWLYLAVLLDLYSRAVVGWAMGARLTGELTQQALQMALQRRQPNSGLLHHSDRGSQYAALAYQQALTAAGITASMSRKETLPFPVSPAGPARDETRSSPAPMIPYTLVLEPQLKIFKIYNGYWYWGRPSIEELRMDLREITRTTRPDWDITRPELREGWKQEDRRASLFYPYGKTLAEVFRSAG